MTLDLLVVDRLVVNYKEPIFDQNDVEIGETIETLPLYHITALKEKFPQASFFNNYQDAETHINQGNSVDVAVVNPLLQWELSKGRNLMKKFKENGTKVIFVYNGIEPRDLKLIKGVHYDKKHGPIYMPEQLIEQIIWSNSHG